MARVQEVHKELHNRVAQACEIHDLDAVAQTIPALEALVNDAPNWPPVIFTLATSKMVIGSYGAAIPYFEWCKEHFPDSPEVWNNLGTCWKAICKDQLAEECWRKAVEMHPSPDYFNNLATLYVNVGQPEKGIPYIMRGLALDPKMSRLHWNWGLLLLEQGMWEKGFEEYENGLYSNDRPLRFYDEDHSKVPFWGGEGDIGKVVVYGEQGMGDEIMYASAIEELASLPGMEVVFDCHPRLINIFRRSFPNITHYPTRKKDKLEWPLEEKPDYKLAAASLFKHFRSHGIFPKRQYLVPDQELTEYYRAKLERLGDPPYVGISWRAGGFSTRADMRSLKLSWFNPILEKGGTFVSLQYTADAKQKIDSFKDHAVHHWQDVVEATKPDGSRYTGFDYDHTAALVNALDLCIVPNTTIVHLCGAIGKKCWTLTPDGCAWRYQLSGEDMVQYGSWVTQIRQRGRDWLEVMEGVGRKYKEEICERIG